MRIAYKCMPSNYNPRIQKNWLVPMSRYNFRRNSGVTFHFLLNYTPSRREHYHCLTVCFPRDRIKTRRSLFFPLSLYLSLSVLEDKTVVRFRGHIFLCHERHVLQQRRPSKEGGKNEREKLCQVFIPPAPSD